MRAVRVPESHLLPKHRGLKAPLDCLNQARAGMPTTGKSGFTRYDGVR
jgi:alkylation response protein AidB-like acyl-CoA dehydrogenase